MKELGIVVLLGSMVFDVGCGLVGIFIVLDGVIVMVVDFFFEYY